MQCGFWISESLFCESNIPVMKKAVFLDRDGTINREVNYLNHPDQMVLLPGAGQAIRGLNEAGFTVVVVTNQSGVARGIIAEEQLPLIRDRLTDLLETEGAKIDGYYYCPHYPGGTVEKFAVTCDCRKPEPGMLINAARDLEIDLGKSYVVGDKVCDVALGRKAGCVAVMVRTGFGAEQAGSGDVSPDYVADDLLEAVRWIIEDSQDPAG